jgi:hypothetical protein
MLLALGSINKVLGVVGQNQTSARNGRAKGVGMSASCVNLWVEGADCVNKQTSAERPI